MSRRPGWVVLALGLLLGCRAPGPAPLVGSFTASVPYELDTLDPHARDLVGQAAIGAQFYEPLVSKDAEMAIKPRLALRWINPDPKTWVFHLRPQVRFHDGRQFSSADVVYTFERLRQHPELEIGVYAQDIESVRATGPLTVELRTRRPLSVLLNKLSQVLVVPTGADSTSLRTGACGTGAYRLLLANPERIEMARNRDYWGQEPAFASVNFRLGRSSQLALDDVVAGQSQLGQCALGAAEKAVAQDDAVRLLRTRGIFLAYLGYDLERESTPHVLAKTNPFRDPRVRHAIDLAIDRQRLVSQLSTFAVPAHQLVPPSIFGFDPALGSRATDPARARELLAAAGYRDGFEVTLHARAMVGESAGVVREMLAQIGIKVSVQQIPEQEFFRVVTRAPSFFLTRYGCDNGDASDVLNAGIHSVDPARNFGGANVGRYANPALDRMIEESAEQTDHDRRRGQLQQIMAVAMQELVWIPLYFDDAVYLVRRPYSFRPRADSYVLASEIGVEPSP